MRLLGGHRPPVFQKEVNYGTTQFSERREACPLARLVSDALGESSAWATAEDRVIDIEQFGNTSSSIPTGRNWEMSFPEIWRSAF